MSTYEVKKESTLAVLNRYVGNVKSRGLVNSLLHHTVQVFLPIYKLYMILSKKTFSFNDKTYRYFMDHYSATWSNERSVEVPIIMAILETALKEGKRILEVGNVLSHYRKNNSEWSVLDKYECQEGVINEDIVSFTTKKRFDLILSISTLEHVGFDEMDIDTTKIDRSIKHITQDLLSNSGRFIFSVPLGYNPNLDGEIYSSTLPITNVYFMKQLGLPRWEQATLTAVKSSKYGGIYYGSASGIAIASNVPL